MSASPVVLGLVVCAATVPLGGCGSQATGQLRMDVDGSSPTSTARAADVGASTHDCRVRVEFAGAMMAQWRSRGVVQAHNASGPTSIYTARRSVGEHDISIQVYTAGEGFEPSAVVMVDESAYATAAGDVGVEADPDGTGAQVDADVQSSVSAPDLHVHATFTC